jgi:pantoate--beta-alanine ligase
MVKGLNMDVEILVLPTMREPSGLAMSSRNSYLSDEERRKASILFAALKAGADLIASGAREPEAVKSSIREMILAEPGITIDYIEAADPENLDPVRKIEQRIVLLVAVRIGRTRLIDNILAP